MFAILGRDDAVCGCHACNSLGHQQAVEDKRPSVDFQPVTTALKLFIDSGDDGVSLPGLFDELEVCTS